MKYFNKEYLTQNKKTITRGMLCIILGILVLFMFMENRQQKQTELISDGQETVAVQESSDAVGESTAGTDGEAAEAAEAAGGTVQDTAPADIVVDIAGAVKKQIVVELPAGSRVSDAIDAAGGLSEKADISGVNRAAVLEDGEKIYIPKKGENQTGLITGASGGESGSSTSGTGKQVSGSDSGRINLNTASSEELQTLNGVGPATAEKIIKYRESYGKFKKVEDLMEVNGIGQKTYEKLKDDLTV